LDDFVAAGLKFILPATQFFQPSALTFELFLRALERHEFLLRVNHPAIHIVARRGSVGRGERRFLRREIGVNKFGGIVFASHEPILAVSAEV
jgi:hypothetical protein